MITLAWLEFELVYYVELPRPENPPNTYARSPLRPRLPRKFRNTHPRNYYDLKGKGIDVHFFYCELNYNDQKIRWTPTHDIREHWTGVSTLLGLISSVYSNLHHWRSNQRPQIAVPKLYNEDTCSYHTQVTPNQQVMIILFTQPLRSGRIWHKVNF